MEKNNGNNLNDTIYELEADLLGITVEQAKERRLKDALLMAMPSLISCGESGIDGYEPTVQKLLDEKTFYFPGGDHNSRLLLAPQGDELMEIVNAYYGIGVEINVAEAMEKIKEVRSTNGIEQQDDQLNFILYDRLDEYYKSDEWRPYIRLLIGSYIRTGINFKLICDKNSGWPSDPHLFTVNGAHLNLLYL